MRVVVIDVNLDALAENVGGVEGKTSATLNPPAFGLAGVNNHTWTGAWGTVSYWNAYVGNLEMHGKGTFYDSRLDDAEKYPVAARTKQATSRTRKTGLPPNFRRYISTSCPCPRRAAAGRHIR